MMYPPHLGPDFMRIVKPVWESDQPDHIKLTILWNMLTGLQGVVIGQILLNRIGDRVFAGPFRGMQLVKDVMRWHFTPALLGTYEWEIHDAVEAIIAKPYKNIVNVGCGYGYYSVGLALRMPQAKIYAYDIDPDMREQCRLMAEANGVSDRVVIGERFNGEDFQCFSSEETFLFMDIEGGENDLLDPVKYPHAAKMDILVELNDCAIPHLSTSVPLRFAPTHNVRVIPNAAFSFPLEKILGPEYIQGHFDNLIATWENRSGPTPYGVFLRKQSIQ